MPKFEVTIRARIPVVVEAPDEVKAIKFAEELVELGLYPSQPQLDHWAKRKRIPSIDIPGIGIEAIVSIERLEEEDEVQDG